MALIYVGAGTNHFINPSFYLRIIPSYLPAPVWLNYISGIAEIVLGILLCFNTTRHFAAWAIAIMLTLFISVHIYMLQLSLTLPRYSISPVTAWVRLLMQPLLIAWSLWYARN